MRVVVTSNGADLDAPASEQFGRSPMLLFVETESMEFEAVANPGEESSSGAGIQAAQFVAESGVAVVITGRVGPKAMNVLAAAGVPVYRFAGGTVRRAVDEYKAGGLALASAGEVRARPETGPARAGTGGSRVAFSSEDDRGLDSVVSHHFGRCPYYVLVDVADGEARGVRTVENPFFADHRPGQVPRFIAEQGADAIVTGGMGRRALEIFRLEKIETVTGAQGTVAEALKDYLDGRLAGARPCRESVQHAGRHHHGHHHGRGRRGRH